MTALGKRLDLDKSSISRRAKEAISKGYLKNLEDKRGRPARLVLADPLPDDVVVLPTLDTLSERCCTVAPLQHGIERPLSPDTQEEMSWTV